MKPLLLLPAVALFAGCVTTLVPHAPYLPAVEKKGEVEVQVASNLLLSKADLQVGYQATGHWVLHTAFMGTRSSGRDAGFLSGELGAGYYYTSPREGWRLGLDAGVAHGGGSSSRSGCFECAGDPFPLSESYRVRYTYGYVQPTVLLKTGQFSWGLALRLGRACYHQLDEVRVDSAGSRAQEFSYAGHQSVFVQPAFLLRYQIRPWLLASGSLSGVNFWGPYSRLDIAISPVTQLSVQFVLGKSAGY